MHLWCWLLAASSIINEVASLPIPKLQQRSLDEAVATVSKQQSNLPRRFFPERLTPRIPVQANSTPDDGTINHVQNALEYLVTYLKLDPRSVPVNSGKHVLQHREKSLNRFSSPLLRHVTLIELEADTSIASQELATRSPWWSQTSQIAARLKRQITCSSGSQCGNGNNSTGIGNGSNNTVNDRGGTSTQDRNIALGVGLGVGLPGAIVAIATIIRYIVRRGREDEKESPNGVKSKKRKDKSQRPASRPHQNSGAQSQMSQPHGVSELGNDQSQQGQWQRPIELETFRK